MIKLYFKEIEDSKNDSKSHINDVISKYLNANKEYFRFYKNEHGKPYLKDYPNTHFNVSRTVNAFVCVLADKPVGVDIEKANRLYKCITRKFFTDNEQKYVFAKNSKQDERFTEIWVKKEAYVKWLGLGMSMPFNSFDVISDQKIKAYRIGRYILGICSEIINNPCEEPIIEVCSKETITPM